MATILEQVKNLEKLSESVIVEQMFQAIKKAEGEVIKANKLQLVKGEDVEGDIVGNYAKSTQSYADRDGIFAPKKFGDPYNFSWSENFLGGFKLALGNEHITLYSTGVGNGDKKEFLTENNLFGLNEENLKEIIQTKVIPFINKFARATLKI